MWVSSDPRSDKCVAVLGVCEVCEAESAFWPGANRIHSCDSSSVLFRDGEAGACVSFAGREMDIWRAAGGRCCGCWKAMLVVVASKGGLSGLVLLYDRRRQGESGLVVGLVTRERS